MIEQLIALPSVSSTQAEIDTSNQPVVNSLANWLNDLGFQTEIVANSDSSDSNCPKVNLIASIGDGDDGLVLSGHTDTVNFDQTGWNTDPFKATQVDDKLYGLGTADMKSFLAIAIEAAKEFTNKDFKQRLTIIATADEESTMQGAKTLVQTLETNGQKLGKYCIIGEPTDLTPIHQHKGVMMEAIKIHGQAGHSSDPGLGNNALEGMRVVLNELDQFKQELANKYINHDFVVPIPTLNLGHIHGGDNPNRICGDCELHIDLRPLPGMQIDTLREQLCERVTKITEPLGLKIEFEALFDGVPAFETDKHSKIIQLTKQLSKKKPTSVAFGTEGPYFNAMGMETVVLGPGSIDQAHQQNEYLTLDSINPTIELLKNVIHEVCIK
ncbi:MAG: acetylornithine deacetylase [Gammaproteobacteria bacterium]|nr:MAG: acetylornithine deacetylase [Gammaproteobacteria bacterium]